MGTLGAAELLILLLMAVMAVAVIGGVIKIFRKK